MPSPTSYSNYYLAKVNNYHDKINNPVARFLYTILQIPVNVIGKALELITKPIGIMAEHIRKNQMLGKNYSATHVGALPATSRLNRIKNGFETFKHRLALLIKLPVDLMTGLFKAFLFFPMFVFKAPYDLLKNAYDFLDRYTDKDETNAIVRNLAIVSQVLLTIPYMPLKLVNNILRDGALPQSVTDYNVSVGGALNAVEGAINNVVHFATWLVTQAAFSPITLGLYVAGKISNSDNISHAQVPDLNEEVKVTSVKVTTNTFDPALANQAPVLLSTTKNPSLTELVTAEPVVQQDQPVTPRTAARNAATHSSF